MNLFEGNREFEHGDHKFALVYDTTLECYKLSHFVNNGHSYLGYGYDLANRNAAEIWASEMISGVLNAIN